MHMFTSVRDVYNDRIRSAVASSAAAAADNRSAGLGSVPSLVHSFDDSR